MQSLTSGIICRSWLATERVWPCFGNMTPATCGKPSWCRKSCKAWPGIRMATSLSVHMQMEAWMSGLLEKRRWTATQTLPLDHFPARPSPKLNLATTCCSLLVGCREPVMATSTASQSWRTRPFKLCLTSHPMCWTFSPLEMKVGWFCCNIHQLLCSCLRVYSSPATK